MKNLLLFPVRLLVLLLAMSVAVIVGGLLVFIHVLKITFMEYDQ